MLMSLRRITFLLMIILLLTAILWSCNHKASSGKVISASGIADLSWAPPDTNSISPGKPGDLIRYGRKLLANTSDYFGPMGSIAHLSHGMNCQNCHLDGGTRLFANNYALAANGYPRQNNRSGAVQTLNGRIQDCFKRSLNGIAPDTNGREVKAIVAYIKWVGRDVKSGQQIKGAATEKLPYLTRAADPGRGLAVYVAKCTICHGADGAGQLTADKQHYAYPPLWGPDSYNDGAGMYRIGNLAGFVKNNMPFGASYLSPQLTNEQAWDVAAFINSQPRPHFDQRGDWKDLAKKPVDLPFGPYDDGFSQKQHKYGPFGPMKKKS
jgi:thiosulfate dehydrogenase